MADAAAPLPRAFALEAHHIEVVATVEYHTRDGYMLRWQGPGIAMRWEVDADDVTVGPEHEGHWALKQGDEVLLTAGRDEDG